LKAIEVAYNYVTVTWTDAATDESTYELRRDGVYVAAMPAKSGGTGKWTFLNLDPKTRYTLQVCAKKVGAPDSCSELSVWTKDYVFVLPPDLVSYAPVVYVVDGVAWGTYTVCNYGQGPAGAFRVTIVLDGLPIWPEFPLSGLAKGECKTLSTMGYVLPGVHTTGIWLDPANAVAESDESNNYKVGFFEAP
jgi:hypothetical protein